MDTAKENKEMSGMVQTKTKQANERKQKSEIKKALILPKNNSFLQIA